MRRNIERTILTSLEISVDNIKHPRYAAFCILEDDSGEIYLAARNTPPHQGIFSAIGGKLDQVNNPNQTSNTAISFDLKADGLETPSIAVRRELIEELYSAIAKEMAMGDNKKADNLIPPDHFQRVMIVYDHHHNSYCFLYTMRTKISIEDISPSAREIQDFKALSTIIQDRKPINPLTHLLLQKLGKLPPTYHASDHYHYGKINRIVRLQEATSFPFRYTTKPQTVLTGETELKEPAFLIEY